MIDTKKLLELRENLPIHPPNEYFVHPIIFEYLKTGIPGPHFDPHVARFMHWEGLRIHGDDTVPPGFLKDKEGRYHCYLKEPAHFDDTMDWHIDKGVCFVYPRLVIAPDENDPEDPRPSMPFIWLNSSKLHR